MGRRKGQGVPKELDKHKFKPGQSGNPEGGRKHANITKALQNLKSLTITTYREMIELALTSNIAALQAIVKDPEAPAIKVGVATALAKAIQNGDVDVLEKLASRIVGKIPDEINLNADVRVAKIDTKELRQAMKKLQEDV